MDTYELLDEMGEIANKHVIAAKEYLKIGNNDKVYRELGNAQGLRTAMNLIKKNIKPKLCS
jgi:hypothetical protein